MIVPAFIHQAQEFGTLIADVAARTNNISDFKITEVGILKKFLAPLIEFSRKTHFFDLNKIFQAFLYGLKDSLTVSPVGLSALAGRIAEIFTILFLIPIIGFFMLHDHEKFRKVFFSIIPNRYFELTVIIIEKADYVLKTFFRAMMVEIVVVAALSIIALTIVGVPYSIVIGILAGVANVIPYLGPAIGIIAAILTILLTGEPLMMIVSTIIALEIVQLLDNQLVYPIIMGRSMEMHPLAILLTVLAGGYTFGLVGMLFAVPVMFLIKEIFIILVVNLRKFEII
jgi:predicted PurR-regulated permease PerM